MHISRSMLSQCLSVFLSNSRQLLEPFHTDQDVATLWRINRLTSNNTYRLRQLLIWPQKYRIQRTINMVSHHSSWCHSVRWIMQILYVMITKLMHRMIQFMFSLVRNMVHLSIYLWKWGMRRGWYRKSFLLNGPVVIRHPLPIENYRSPIIALHPSLEILQRWFWWAVPIDMYIFGRIIIHGIGRVIGIWHNV